jgi:CRP/FNR family nitrogen fixation transcriptional regulator
MQEPASPPSIEHAPSAAEAPPDPCGLARLKIAVGLRRYRAGETVYLEGAPAERVYEVVAGLVRTVRSPKGGRRVVDDFFVPGDVFGLSGERTHDSAAEAVVDTRLRHCERAALERLALVDQGAAATLWSWLACSVQRAAARAPLLACGDPREKLQAFLFEMADRLDADGRVELAMSRSDMADHLGLSSETVSRTFAALSAQGLIALEGRTAIILEPMARRRADGGAAGL